MIVLYRGGPMDEDVIQQSVSVFESGEARYDRTHNRTRIRITGWYRRSSDVATVTLDMGKGNVEFSIEVWDWHEESVKYELS